MSVRLINPLPLCLFFSVCLCLSFTHSHLSFSVLAFVLGWDIWNQWIHPYSLIIEYSSAYCVVTRHPYYRQPEQWDAGCSQWKTDVLYHVCNDRQQSAFRVPAFIIVNVDDTGLLPSWQTVMELSGLHNHWLCTAMITFKLMNANLLGTCVVAWVGRRLCMYEHAYLPAPRQYILMQEFLLFWTHVCCLSDWRQCNLDSAYHYHTAWLCCNCKSWRWIYCFKKISS